METEQLYNYERLLQIDGQTPCKKSILSKDKLTSTTETITVLVEFNDGKEWLFQFFYWILPRHGISEQRLSSYKSNQLI